MKLTVAILAALAMVGISLPAMAGALQPMRPVPQNLYSGRWYEIARTPNHTEGDCQASTYDFAGWAGGRFSAVQTCHQGGPSGPARSITVSGRVLPQTQNTKMQLALLGGLLTQQYWILDHAANDAWLIMTTPNNRYVWLMSRQPVLTGADRTAALTRLQQFGFNLSRLMFPAQATH